MQQMTIQGIPISDIAEQFGTPLYVYDGESLTERYRALRRALPATIRIHYSFKANPNVSVCALLRQCGAGAEVSSAAELATAQWAGFRPDDVLFVGPGKSDEELRACVDQGIQAVVCESLAELAELDRIAGRAGREIRALLRVNPDFEVTGSGLAMGGKPRQFGIDLAELRHHPALAANLRHVRIAGIHVYAGTRFLHHADVVANTRRVLELAESLTAELGIPLDTVDIGGGLGVAYFPQEQDLDTAALTTELSVLINGFAERRPNCRIIMELGRYLTAMAGTYVVRAHYVKTSMGERFVVTDGGTHHHMAAVGIGAFVKRNFPLRSLTRYDQPAQETYTVVGPLCTPGDVIGRKVTLPPVEPGDLLGIERSGAYGLTASPVLFLSHRSPAEVLVQDGTAHLIRARGTIDDLLAQQRLIAFDNSLEVAHGSK